MRKVFFVHYQSEKISETRVVGNALMNEDGFVFAYLGKYHPTDEGMTCLVSLYKKEERYKLGEPISYACEMFFVTTSLEEAEAHLKLVPYLKMQKKVGVMIWRQISPGVNHPKVCNPSLWLVKQVMGKEESPVEYLAELGQKALAMRMSCLRRPLGSSYYPWPGGVYNIAYYYGDHAQKVLYRIWRIATRLAKDFDKYREARVKTGFQPSYSVLDISKKYLDVLGAMIEKGEAPRVASAITLEVLDPEWINIRNRLDAKYGEQVKRFGFALEILRKYEIQEYDFVEEIDEVVEAGGDLCVHTTGDRNWWADVFTDGGVKLVALASRVKEHGDQHHIGCFASAAEVHVRHATLLLVKKTYRRYQKVDRLWLTDSVKPEELELILSTWKEESARPLGNSAWSGRA